jgi:hypothetical protein
MKLTRNRIIILIVSMITGECAAIYLIFMLITSAGTETIDYTDFTNNATYSIPAAQEESTDMSVPPFNIRADIEVANNLISINEDIDLRKTGSSIVIYVPSVNLADTEILKVASGGIDVKFTLKDTYLEVNSPSVMDKLHLEYKITLADKPDMLSYAEGRTLLCNFLATPAVYKNGSPILTYKWAFGDPYMYDVNDYQITFRTDKDLAVYAPGKKKETIDGRTWTTICEARNLRDFSSVLLDDASIKTEKIGNTLIHYVDSYDSAVYAGQAFRFAEEKVGPYIYEELFIIRVPIALRGMELSNMILLSDSCFSNKEDLKRVVYHEMFHQWFYGIIGTDQMNEPFLDEGLANYLALRLCNYNPGRNYSKEFLKLSLKDYESKQVYYSYAYDNAAAYFSELHGTLGDRFYLLLQKIYDGNKFSTLYFEDFLKLVDEYLGGQ